MCELFGMSFNKPVSPNLSFRGFSKRGDRNPNGWGLAFYPDKAVQIMKEPIRARDSPLSDFLKDYDGISSDLFIAHVRITSAGSTSYRNTHPFQREVGGRDYVFAHNGTLRGYGDLVLGRFLPIGETDSEHAFCHIINSISARGVVEWTSEDYRWMSQLFKDINSHGNFNCILSDGERLFCYHDANGYNGLKHMRREAPFERMRMMDEELEIDLQEQKDPTQRGFIISTRKLTDEEWVDFNPGELIVFSGGVIVYSSARDAVSSSPEKERNGVSILNAIMGHPERIRLGLLIQITGLPKDEVLDSLQYLMMRGYIRQDRRDMVKWDHNDATYYTMRDRRNEIMKIIGQ